MSHYCWVGMAVRLPIWSPLTLLRHPSREVGYLITPSQRYKSKFPTRSLLVWESLKHGFFSFGACLGQRVFCLKTLSVQCPFPGPLAKESRLLLRIFFYLQLFGISELYASSASCLNHMKQKESPGSSPPCCFLDLKVLFSLHLSEYFYVCFIFYVQGFQSCLLGAIGKYISSIFLEAEVTGFF